MANLTYSSGTGYCEYAGLSTDTDPKPTEGVGVGSIFVEVDTGKVFFYSGTAWVEQFSFQG